MSIRSLKEIENDLNAVNDINEILNANQIHILINQNFFAIIISLILLIDIVKYKNEGYNYQRVANYNCDKKVPGLAEVPVSIDKIPFFEDLAVLIVIVSLHLLLRCFIDYVV
jgi:hypothetical protein